MHTMLRMLDAHLGARGNIHDHAAGAVRRLQGLSDAVAAQAHELRVGVLELALQPRTPLGRDSISITACLAERLCLQVHQRLGECAVWPQDACIHGAGQKRLNRQHVLAPKKVRVMRTMKWLVAGINGSKCQPRSQRKPVYHSDLSS